MLSFQSKVHKRKKAIDMLSIHFECLQNATYAERSYARKFPIEFQYSILSVSEANINDRVMVSFSAYYSFANSN